jgi:tetratricopeptide (TPR) repeat protein
METDDDASGVETVDCPHCGIATRLIPVRPFMKPPTASPQFTEPSVLPDNTFNYSDSLPAKSTNQLTNLAKAEQLHLQGTFRLNECQAHYKVYGSRLGKQANDGLEFVDAALRLFPDNPKYLNTRALLLADGLGQIDRSIEILQRARRIAPDDIQIRQNLRDANAALENSRTMTVVAIIIVVLIVVGIIIFVVNNN